MNKKKRGRISFWVGLAAGALADGYLRLVSGDEGNLLVHTAVFLGSAAIAAGLVRGLFFLWDGIRSRKK